MVDVAKVTPYGFAAAFERVLAVALINSQKLYGAVGHEIDATRIADLPARHAILACHAIAKDTGRGPAAGVLVVQRLQRWCADGKLTQASVDDVLDMLDEYHEAARIPHEAILDEVLPVIKRQLQADAVRAAIDEYSRGSNMARVAATIKRAETVGTFDKSAGLTLGRNALKAIAKQNTSARLPTGVFDLDAGLCGGLPRGKAGMIVGGAKGGKSMWMTSMIANALKLGKFVVLATLELSEEEQHSRLIANLLNVPIDYVIANAESEDLAEAVDALLPQLGRFEVKFFPPTATSIPDIAEWISETEDASASEGGPSKVDLFVLDYLDKCCSTNRNHTSGYDIQGQVAEDFRLYCHGRNIWGWTGSQRKRTDAKERGKRIHIDDVGDSQNKVRVMDLIVTVHSPTPDEVELYVAGNRNGPDKFGVGPYVHNFACAQFCALAQGGN